MSIRAKLVLAAIALGLLTTACRNFTSVDPERDAPVTTNPTIATPSSAPQVTSSQPNYYELAQEKAHKAWSLSQFARSRADWRLVIIQWQDAIVLLEAVPADNSDQATAQIKMIEYQSQLAYAQQQANSSIESDDNLVAVAPPKSSPAASNSVPSSQSSNQTVFTAPIKRLAGGTPVINVTLNDSEQVEMIVDTGASGTVITQQTATNLGIVPVNKVKAKTASGKTVEFPIGYIDSIAVDGTSLKHVPVAIAPANGLEIGLLGRDFLGNFDVTIRRNVIEFRAR